MLRLLYIFTLASGIVTPGEASNGSLAIAIPLEGIVVDGDLDDWPEDMVSYPIELHDWGEPPSDVRDFNAHFRIGYNSDKRSLYLAIVVKDESVWVWHGPPSIPSFVERFDGCAIYIASEDSSSNVEVIQYRFRGGIRDLGSTSKGDVDDFQVEARWSDDEYHLEAIVKIGDHNSIRPPITPNLTLGFDIGLWDNDRTDDSSSWVVWGPGRKGAGKDTSPEALGTVLLVDDPENTAVIHGAVKWEDWSSGITQGLIQITSESDESLNLFVKPDSSGRFEVEVPQGGYYVTAGYGREMTEAKQVEVYSGQVIEIEELHFKRPQMGKKTIVGRGKLYEAGSGFASGSWHNFDTVDGLPSKDIWCMLEDPSGSIWIGTSAGLVHYDSETFTVYGVSDGLSGNDISAMFYDGSGGFWITTRPNGLTHYDGVNFTVYDKNDGLNVGYIFSNQTDDDRNIWLESNGGLVHYDGQRFTNFTDEYEIPEYFSAWQNDVTGGLWVGTYDLGLYHYDRGETTLYTTKDGLTSNSITTLLKDSAGSLWIGTDQGLLNFENGEFTHFMSDENAPTRTITSLLQGSNGILWIGAESGIHRYDGETFTKYILTAKTGPGLDGTLPKPRSIYNVSYKGPVVFFEDKSNHVWGHTDSTIFRYDGTTFHNYGKITGFDYLGLRKHTTTEDALGRVWVSLWQEGVIRIDGLNVDMFNSENGLSGEVAYFIKEDRAGNLWVGTDGGLSRYTNDLFTKFSVDDGLQTDRIYCIDQSVDGILYIGSSMGLSLLYGKKFVSKELEYLYSSISSITTTDSGDIWLGSNVNLHRISSDKITSFGFSGMESTFRNYDSEEEFIEESTNITSILASDSNDIWIGTALHGLFHYDGKSFEHFSSISGLGISGVFAILEDRKGRLWIGGHGGYNLSRFDGEIFENFDVPGDGDHAVNCLLEDDIGRLWIGTTGGLFVYDGVSFIGFGVSDGLGSNDISELIQDTEGHIWIAHDGGITRYFAGVFQHLSSRDGISGTVTDLFQDRDQNIWIATTKGLYRYNRLKSMPPIHIYDVISDRRHGPVKTVSLQSSQKSISFEYQGISFASRKNSMAYVYRLQGFDEDWQVTRKRTVSYNNVPIGNYTFQVKAIDRDFNYSDEPATVNVKVTPPYELILLWLGVGVAVLGLCFATGYGIRKSRAQRRAEEAEAQAQHELLGRMQEELEEARQLQLSLLPEEYPMHASCDVAWYMKTATEVGGDYYDYMLAQDGTLTLTLGDATGHGMAAGTLVSVTKSLFRTFSEQDNIAEIFNTMSHSLSDMNMKRIYMAMNMIKVKNGKMRVSSAGIPPVLLYRYSSKHVEEILLSGLPLGCRTRIQYQQMEYELSPGDTVLMMSDGLPERNNRKGEEMGYHRVEALFAEVGDQPAEKIVQHLVDGGESWADGLPQDDDVTLIVLKVKS